MLHGNPVRAEQVLRVDLNYRLSAQIEFPQHPARRARSVRPQLLRQKFPRHAVQADCRRCQRGGCRRRQAPQGMQCHILDCGQRQKRGSLEPDGAVPHEAGSVPMGAGEVEPGRRFAQPKPVMGSSAGAAQTSVVQDRGLDSLIAVRQDENPAPGLGDARRILEPQQVPTGKPGIEKLSRTGNPAGLRQIIKNVHRFIGGPM